MRLEQDEVDSTETTDSRDEDSHSKRRQKSTSGGGRMSAFIHTEDKAPEKSNRRQSTRSKDDPFMMKINAFV